MSAIVFQIRVQQAGGTIHRDHVVRTTDATAIHAALKLYPSVPWELWVCKITGERLVYAHTPCNCGNEDVMQNLGMACAVSCGRAG